MGFFDKNKIENFLSKLKDSRKIAMFVHENPDGDAIGSALGIGKILEKQGKKVSYFSPSEISPKFYFLEEVKKFSTEFDYGDYDVLIFCDIGSISNQLKFWSQNKDYWQTKFKIIFDHHKTSEDWGDITFRDPAFSSTCFLVYEFIKKIGWTELIDSRIATYLIMGHLTDTNFCKRSKKPDDMKCASELMERGGDKDLILENLFYNSSWKGVKFLEILLERMEKIGNLVYTWYDIDELPEGVDREDADYVMELMRKIKEVSIYLLIRKQGEFIKCSIRTKFDGADRIASQLFGGGGHPRAAGCKIKFDSNQPLLKQVKQIVDKILDFKI